MAIRVALPSRRWRHFFGINGRQS